jgi:phosphate transport system substrate-binding protein
MKKVSWMISLALMSAASTGASAATEFQGAGSSAAAPIYKAWASEYQKTSGAALNYESIGSGAGINKIATGQVDFGASDVAPAAADLLKQGLVLFPIAITGIAPVVNLPQITDGQLKLTGPVLAQIFSAGITRWNAPAIAELNPKLNLPDLAIVVVVRGEGSGTTYHFSDYLSKVSPAWKSTLGVGSSIAWHAGFTAVKGSADMVKTVRDTAGAIGYVDHGYVKGNKIASVSLKNAEDEFLAPTNDGFRSALMSSEWMAGGKFNTSLNNMKGKKSWPITMGTYALMPQVTDKPERTLRALKFFTWAFVNGDRLVQVSNFVRLPDAIQAMAFKSISAIKDTAGNPIGKKLFGE